MAAKGIILSSSITFSSLKEVDIIFLYGSLWPAVVPSPFDFFPFTVDFLSLFFLLISILYSFFLSPFHFILSHSSQPPSCHCPQKTFHPSSFTSLFLFLSLPLFFALLIPVPFFLFLSVCFGHFHLHSPLSFSLFFALLISVSFLLFLSVCFSFLFPLSLFQSTKNLFNPPLSKIGPFHMPFPLSISLFFALLFQRSASFTAASAAISSCQSESPASLPPNWSRLET